MMTLTHILKERASLSGKGMIFIASGNAEEFLSYAALHDCALKTLHYLQRHGIRPKDELVFQIDDNKTFIIVFWACLLGGIIPVPLSTGNTDERRNKLFRVWQSLNNPFLITGDKQLDQLKAYATRDGAGIAGELIRRTVLAGEAVLEKEKGQEHAVRESDIAFIQFSSGSTGSPKGVVLTHRNLLTNIAAISKAAAYTALDSMISWMPLTHDMGLIGFHLNPLVAGINQYLIPTDTFVRRPAVWLDTASQHRATILCSPNFGYSYLLKHGNFSGRPDWDLSSVRIIYNGAEPVSEPLCQEFLDKLSEYGLKRKAMCPVYGLAEASLAVSISGLEDEVISCRLDRDKISFGDCIRPGSAQKGAVTFVNVGKPVENCSVLITDHHHAPLPDQTIGHVQIKGDNVTAGYYNDEKASRALISPDGWLKTGDLGFIREGALYITGREKDIIFVNGQNFYPHDVERIAQAVEGIELNKIAVAGCFDPIARREEIIAFVHHRGELSRFVPLAAALRMHVNGELGLEIDKVLPVQDIPKTTSGKLQRYKLIEQYKAGRYEEAEQQLGRLVSASQTGADQAAQPGNDLEAKLLAVWQRVLKNNAIGVNDRFFQVGGNSLRAAEVAMYLARELGAELPVAFFYEKGTIRELAAEIAGLDKAQYRPVPGGQPCASHPVSSAQKRLYYAWAANQSSVAYNVPLALSLAGSLDKEKLEDCIRQLIARHDALRMTFFLADGPQLRVHDGADFTLHCTEALGGDLDEALKTFVEPFDLAQAPLLRAKLIGSGPDQYTLLLDFHHIIADGTSVYHFVDELFRLYHGQALPALPIGYCDYCRWEAENLQSEKLHAQQKYWRDNLPAELPVLEMPTDFPRPALFSGAGGKVQFQFDDQTRAALGALAKAHNATLPVLLFALYSLLLSRYTGQDRIIIGLPVAGRRHADLLNLLGMFINNLAVPAGIDRESTFAEFLHIQQRNFTSALANQDYPFANVAEQAGQRRDASRNPVFDTMFVYQDMGLPQLSGPGLRVSYHFFDPGFSKFDLSLEVLDLEDGLRYAFEYSTDLFRQETITGLAHQFGRLVENVLNNPGGRLADLFAISRAEYNAYVEQFNATQSAYPADKTIHALFLEQVNRAGARPAIEYEGETISYRQLNERANGLAARLQQQEVGPGTIVALLLERSPELIISMLGVLKAGGAYLPIEQDLPEERIGYILNASRCSTVLVADRGQAETAHRQEMAHRQEIATGGRKLTWINLPDLDLVAGAREEVADVSTPADLAYVIYTSGTTGNPKGVMVGHRSLVNYIHWAANTYVKGRQYSFALFTSVAFDLTVTSIFTPLVTGNKVVIYREQNDLVLDRVMEDNRANVIKLTPSHLKLLSNGLAARPAAASRVKVLIVGGEALSSQLARQVYDTLGGDVEIYNEYGPTEATVGCMIHQFSPGEEWGTVPIGVPIANTRIYVLDAHGKPLPEGICGEIYIAGDALAKGYLFAPELTRQQFVPDPFIGGEKMYKTGDLARRLSSGALEFVGRADQQVKINGFRVELSEIESQLKNYAGISDALVVLSKNRRNADVLCAYYTTGEAAVRPVEESALRAHVAGRLPYYMIPAHFIPLQQVPLTHNGKIDHAALPVPDAGVKRADPPATGAEMRALRVWGAVLGEPDLSVTDNFFELGGDSIKAVQIASRLREQGVSVAVKDILTYQTIEQVARYARPVSAANPYRQGIIEGEAGLTPIAAWFLGQHLENPHFYNQSVLLDLGGQVEATRLEQALARVVAHHDELRLNYDAGKNVLFYNGRHLHEGLTLERFQVAGQAGLPGVCRQLRSGFDITRDLLLRAAILSRPGEADKLFITAHHLVMDGVSWRIFLSDLYAAYGALALPGPVALPGKTATFGEWHEALLAYRVGSQAQEYWKRVESVPFSLPRDFDTTDWRVENRERLTWSLDRQATHVLIQGAYQTYRADVPVMLNAALALALQEWTGLRQFVIEHENHGRHLEGIDVSRTLGWFTALYPVVLQLEGDSLDVQIKAVKEQLRGVPDQGMSYGMYAFRQPGGPTAAGRSEIRFNYLGQMGEELNNELFRYNAQPTGTETDEANHLTTKLEWNSMVIDGVFTLELLYNGKAHRQTTIQRLGDRFFDHLRRILGHLGEQADVHFTPSDFEMAGLNQEELDALFE